MAKRLAVVVPVALLVANLLFSSPVSTAFAHSTAQAHVYTTAHTSAQRQIQRNQLPAKATIPLFCQGPYYFVLYLPPHGTPYNFADCAGDYYNPDLYADGYYSSRWSGFVIGSPTGQGGFGYTYYFCNGQYYGFPGGSNFWVYEVQLNYSKAGWC